MTTQGHQAPNDKSPDGDAQRHFESVARLAIESRSQIRGELLWPAVPSMLPVYTDHLVNIFAASGTKPTGPERDRIAATLEKHLRAGFESGPGSYVHVIFEPTPPPKSTLTIKMGAKRTTLEQQYKNWQWDKRDDTSFGKRPDAFVVDMARSFDREPANLHALDLGAGTGRNAVALAEMGMRVEALEAIPKYGNAIREKARAQLLGIAVTEGDMLAPEVAFEAERFDLVVASEVCPHFRSPADLGKLAQKVAPALAPGGRFVFNCFVPETGYRPGPLARELSYVAWSSLITPAEIEEQLGHHGLRVEKTANALEYEKRRCPAEEWPPTAWFENWATGQNVFPLAEGTPPCALTWVVAERE